MPFLAKDGSFWIKTAEDTYRPFFVKGVNLGSGLPGTQAGTLAISHEQYLRWFQQMSDMGVNVFRVYTLHFPRFYDALFEFNNYRPENPLYVMHGLWLDEEHPEHSIDLWDHEENFIYQSRTMIDAIHGNITIDHRLGRAFGEYQVNISDWVVGYIAGREVFPSEVNETDKAHPESRSYEGSIVSLADGPPTDVWWAEQIDNILVYEKEKYGVLRPITVSSWPTLDPLFHRTEAHFADDDGEDAQQIDLATLDTRNYPAGYFANFHAYPYYPNFVSETPEYQAFEDEMGPNSYIGYVKDLVDHYYPMPVLIGEFGVPTSWGNAHYGHSGMNHGGHTVSEQGLYGARMLRNQLEVGSAGGLLFSWQDEWWKRTWIVDELQNPRDRFRFWHNMTSPEENFGLIRFDFEPPGFDLFPAKMGSGLVRRIDVDYDAEYFHVRVELSRDIVDGETVEVAFDTYRDDLGERTLPGGALLERRHEVVASVTAPDPGPLYILPEYTTLGIWHALSEPHQIYRSVKKDTGEWDPVVWLNDSAHFSDDGSFAFPPTYDEGIGRLVVRRENAPEEPYHDAAVIDGRVVTLRIPWTLLHFSDPSQMQVLHDDLATRERENAVSGGIAVGVAFQGAILETGRFSWPFWDEAPPTVEVKKPSFEIYAAALRELPFFLD